MSTFEITKPFLEELEEKIIQADKTAIGHLLADLHYGDISALLYETNPEQAKFVIESLEKEAAAEILSDLEEDFRVELVKQFDSTALSSYADFMDSDDAVDMLKEQPIQTREEVIALMRDRQKARHIIHLLPYDEDTAGGLMAKEYIKANINWDVKQCIEEVRRQAEKVDKIYSIYVVNDEGILKGRVSLKKIILSPDSIKIADIYEADIITIESYLYQEDVAEIMQRYDLEALPVVNVKGKLLGRITIDDIIDVITEQAEYERQVMSGISSDVEEDDNIWKLTKARLPWLIIGMVGGIAGAQFIGLFEQDLILLPAMAFFIPLITATGGNVGIQSSSIIIQSLASKTVLKGAFQRIFKVFSVAIINGIVLSSIVFGANMLLVGDIKLSLVVACALFFVVILA
ncbi:MAG: magnesium transporter, partial [Bacteroidota bacterium]